jgi:23S rRNA pseudouridine2604 synthase
MTVLIHKPVGYVSAQPEHGQIPAVRLITPANLWGEGSALTPGFDSRLAPAGRLDMDSRGLLILSEDGVVAKAVIGPTSRLDKEYVVRVTGEVTPQKLDLLRHGLELDGRQLKPAEVTQLGSHEFRMILHEGRNRQIRRMCDLVEIHVSDLFRVRIGPLHLGDLPAGRWRFLSAEERAALLAAA